LQVSTDLFADRLCFFRTLCLEGFFHEFLRCSRFFCPISQETVYSS
jgi:hypothetical protein